MKPPFKLSLQDLNSTAWMKLKEHLEERLDQHRRANDGDLDDVRTAKQRGRIAEAKYILSLGTDKSAPKTDAGDS